MLVNRFDKRAAVLKAMGKADWDDGPEDGGPYTFAYNWGKVHLEVYCAFPEVIVSHIEISRRK